MFRMMKKIILTLSIVSQFFSCSGKIEPPTPNQLFEKYNKSVVLIASQYYYEVYSGNDILYYSPSAEKKIFFSKDEVLANLSFSTGTGFIVSKDGKIVTNNHVVNQSDESFKVELAKLYDDTKTIIASRVQKYNDTIQSVKELYLSYSDQMDYYQKQTVESRYNDIIVSRDNLLQLYKKIDNLKIDSAYSKLVIYKLGIAFNNTFITEVDDLQECVVLKTSIDENIDLALIQTKDKDFNKVPETIFDFNDKNPNSEGNDKLKRNLKNPISINDDVYMIGFNRGFTLATTKYGIKCQFTSGKVSQESDGQRLLYTIPTLEGSSGSPIIDKWGNLVGVNFAKVANSQSFSFGIPVYQVKKFLEE